MSLLLRGVGGGIDSLVNSHPLDGLSPTAAWSMSRRLLSSYGAALYRTTSGNADTIYNQAGGGATFDLVNVTTSQQPGIGSAGPNNIAAALFDGVDDTLAATALLSSYISASAGYCIMSFIPVSAILNTTPSYHNDVVFQDAGTMWGFFLRNDGPPPHLYGYNWDGAEKATSQTISIGTPCVAEWRHEGGILYLDVNGIETSLATGNTQTLTSAGMKLANAASKPSHISLFEMATFSTVPSSTVRGTLVNNFRSYVGA